MRGAVVKDQFSLTANSEGASSNFPAKPYFYKLYIFCLFSFMIIFPVIVTADPLKLRENFAITYF